jgi:hypothetical protein
MRWPKPMRWGYRQDGPNHSRLGWALTLHRHWYRRCYRCRHNR